MLNLLPTALMIHTATRKGYRGLMADITGMSERLFQSPNYGPRSATGQTRAQDNGREWAYRRWCARGFPPDDVAAWQKEQLDLAKEERLGEVWLQGLNGPEPIIDYSATAEYVRQIDEMSWSINQGLRAQSLTQIKQTLLGDSRLEALNRADLLGTEDKRRERTWECIDAADTIEDLVKPLKAFQISAFMAILARLDAEFSSQYFEAFVPWRSFTLVTPRLRTDIETLRSSRGKHVRDWCRTPVRRLLDVLACLAYRFEFGYLPNESPTMTWFASIAFGEEESSTILSKKLTRWRNGEVPFTLDDFDRMWRSIHDNLAEAGQEISFLPPFPLVFAAIAWQTLYVYRGQTPRGRTMSVNLMEEGYLDYWPQETRSAPSDLITEPWPECFVRI